MADSGSLAKTPRVSRLKRGTPQNYAELASVGRSGDNLAIKKQKTAKKTAKKGGAPKTKAKASNAASKKRPASTTGKTDETGEPGGAAEQAPKRLNSRSVH